MAARIGGAVDQVHHRPLIIDRVVGRRVEIVVADDGQDALLGLEGPRIAIGVGTGRAGGASIGGAEHVGLPANVAQDGAGLLAHRRLAVRRAVGEEIFARIGIGFGRGAGIADQVGDRGGDVGEVLPVIVVRAGDIGAAQRRPEAIRQAGEVAIGDEGIP